MKKKIYSMYLLIYSRKEKNNKLKKGKHFQLSIEISMVSFGISSKPTGFRKLIDKLSVFVFKFWFMKFVQNLPASHSARA